MSFPSDPVSVQEDPAVEIAALLMRHAVEIEQLAERLRPTNADEKLREALAQLEREADEG